MVHSRGAPEWPKARPVMSHEPPGSPLLQSALEGGYIRPNTGNYFSVTIEKYHCANY